MKRDDVAAGNDGPDTPERGRANDRPRRPPERRPLPDGGRVPDDDEDASGSGDGDPDEEEDRTRAPPGSNISRRTIIRILIVLGIGIPIAIEGRTLLGLIMQALRGDGDAATPTTTGGTGTTTTSDPVGVGDELLPETAQTERVVEGYVKVDGSTSFTMTVDIDNQSGTEYELRLGTLTTSGGSTVEGGASSGRLDPGSDGSVTGTWELPSGDRPESVRVIAISVPASGSPTTVDKTVELGSFQVQR